MLLMDIVLSNEIADTKITDSLIIASSVTTGFTNFFFVQFSRHLISSLSSFSTGVTRNKLRNNIIVVTAILALIMSLLLVNSELIVVSIFDINDTSTLRAIQVLLPYCVVNVIFQAIIQLSNVSNVLNEKPRILPNSAIVNALFSSLFIFVCYDTLGVRSIGLAIVFGGFIQLLIVATKSQHYRDSQVKASSKKIDDSGQLPGSIMMLLLLNGLNEFIKIYEKGLSASFGGGVVTMIYYSNKVTLTIASLVLAAVTYLYLPKLSRQESPMKEIRKRILNPRTLSLGLFLFLLTYLSIPLVVNLLFNGQGVFLNEQEFGVISKLSLLSALGYLILNMLTMLQLAEGRKYLAYLPLGLLFVVKMLLYLFTRSILELNAFYVPKIGVISYGISILLCLLIYRLILWKYRL